MENRYFIDCGSNIGDTIDLFLQNFKNAKQYQIIAFEPNKQLKSYYKKYENVTLYQKAVWIADETKEFYIGIKNEHSTNSRLDDFYQGRKKEKFLNESESVECIDFSRYIAANFSTQDEIILKLDIEGAEYQVLSKMIADNTISFINELYIEFHNTQKTEHYDRNELAKTIMSKGIKVVGNYDGGGVEFNQLFKNSHTRRLKKIYGYIRKKTIGNFFV